MTDAEEIEHLKEELKRLQQALHYEQWLAGRLLAEAKKREVA